MDIVALIPAHDEEDQIVDTIRSLRAQTRAPDRIIVAADNCTDATVELALAEGAEVRESVANIHRKAGALNQVLEQLLPALGADDAVLVMDADTVMAPRFLEIAAAHLTGRGTRARRRRDTGPIGGVGGLFVGKPKGSSGLVQVLQQNEYTRYCIEITAKGGRAAVLTGTGTLFSVPALQAVWDARRRGELPGGDSVYDVWSLTEDNEMTLAIKHLGYRCVSPSGCIVETDIMATWPDLWNQRLRWQRGALDNLRHYGWTDVTRRYVMKQAAMYMGGLLSLLYTVLLVTALVLYRGIEFNPFWTGLTAVFVIEKMVTVWTGSTWKQRAVALTLLPELAYDAFQWLVFIKAGVMSMRRTAQAW